MRGYEHCYGHRPDLADERRRNASRGGHAGGRGRGGSELAELKREVRDVIGGVLNGRIDKGDGSVALQGFNVLIRATEQERRLREQEDFLKRLEELEESLSEQNQHTHRRGA